MKGFVVLLAIAALAWADRSFMESHLPRAVPPEYSHMGRVAPAESIRLIFAAKLRNVADLDRQWNERADPKSASYAQWMSVTELKERYEPSEATMDKIVSMCVQHGATNVTVRDIGFVDATFTRVQAEQLLNTEFHTFQHKRTKEILKRSISGTYSLPSDVAHLLDFVEGVRRLPIMTVRPRIRKNRSNIGLSMTPKVIRSRYGTVGIASKNKNNSQCVAQFIGQHYSPADLSEFYTLYSPADKGTQPIIIGNNAPPAGVEAELDIQYITAIGHAVNRTFFWVTNRNDQHPFMDFVLAVMNTTSAPLIISVSYGEAEAGNTADWVIRMNSEFQLMGLRGISVLFASGDSGVSADGNCPNSQFEPDWPATSPAVTAVGGSHLGFLETGRERVWSDGGGGFSNVFPAPAYQQAAIAAYKSKLSNHLPNQKYWNATGRAYPDVAAFAVGFMVVIDFVPQPVDGTSCATPTFSGVVALLNDARLNAGKPPLGPLNPWLYSLPAGALTDITDGCIIGCLGVNGFCAAPGWDPASGLGSPNYSKLLKYL